MKLFAEHTAAVEVTFLNANGFPAKVEGEVTWGSTNLTIATVVADAEDSTKAVVTAGPMAGSAEIIATADADLGEGVTPITVRLAVEVLARGAAIGGEINVLTPDQGLPVERPEVDNELPEIRPDVDNELPESGAKPKK